MSYTLLAKAAGADKSHPEAEQREQEFDRRVKEYHARLAAQENQAPLKDTTVLTKGIRAVWILIGLVVPAVLAWRVLFNSPDLYEYYVNREVFYDVTIWCTLIYFVFAWWDLQRSKSLQRGPGQTLRHHLPSDALRLMAGCPRTRKHGAGPTAVRLGEMRRWPNDCRNACRQTALISVHPGPGFA